MLTFVVDMRIFLVVEELVEVGNEVGYVVYVVGDVVAVKDAVVFKDVIIV